MDNLQTILGNETFGGGLKLKKNKRVKIAATSIARPKTAVNKVNKKKTPHILKHNGVRFFGGVGNEVQWNCKCTQEVPATSSTTSQSAQTPDSTSSTSSTPLVQSGGNAIRIAYQKKLNAMPLNILRNMAKKKGLIITKKKNGKTVYLKKKTIIDKLCELKHGK